MLSSFYLFFVFFFNDTATTEIYTLSLHDALPISATSMGGSRTPPSPSRNRKQHVEQDIRVKPGEVRKVNDGDGERAEDRKSTRLNSSHGYISYAVFCLKKKKKNNRKTRMQRVRIR